MNYRSLTFLLIILISSTGFSQTRAMFVGAWEFTGLAEEQKKELTDSQQDLFKMMLDKTVLQYDNDGRYCQNMNGDAPFYGNWSVNKELTEMYDEADRGGRETVKIIRLTKNELVIEVVDIYAVFKRIDPIYTIPEKPIASGVAITKNQLVKLWHIQKRIKAGDSMADAKPVMEASYDFRANGTYTYSFLGVEAEGTWIMGKKTGEIILVVGGKTTEYYVKKVTQNELHLQKGAGGVTYLMSTTK
ncbi:MAG: hypothetical protein AAFY71_19570 [Bacteroidota bacterium]